MAPLPQKAPERATARVAPTRYGGGGAGRLESSSQDARIAHLTSMGDRIQGEGKPRPYISALQIKVDRALPGSSLLGDRIQGEGKPRPYISCVQDS